MEHNNNLFILMREYEITDSLTISDLDKEILKEMKMYFLCSADSIRSLLNDFKLIVERKGA